MRITNAVRQFWSAAAIAIIFGFPLKAETLTDALIGAYKNSNLLSQQQALLRATDEGAAQAIAALRPVITYALGADYTEIDGGIGATETFGVSGQIDIRWLLYDFGASQFSLEAQREVVLATRQALIDVEQRVLLTAVRAYMTYREAFEIVALRQSNLRLIQRELRAAQDRFEVGEVTRTDVAIAQSRLAEARSGLVDAQGALVSAREAYRVAIGRYPGHLSALPHKPKTASSVQEARAVGLRRHPSIVQSQHEIRAAELLLENQRAALKPTVNLNAQFFDGEGSNDRRSVGVDLRGTIYSGGALKSRTREQFARVEAERAGLRISILEVGQNVATAWSDVQVARAQITSAREQVRAARVAFQGLREEAALGARTTLEVLDAEQDLLSAQTSLLGAQTREYVAIYQLLSDMGLLTADHLRLGIATYDPAAYYEAVKNAPVRSIRGERLDRVLKSLGKN